MGDGVGHPNFCGELFILLFKTWSHILGPIPTTAGSNLPQIYVSFVVLYTDLRSPGIFRCWVLLSSYWIFQREFLPRHYMNKTFHQDQSMHFHIHIWCNSFVISCGILWCHLVSILRYVKIALLTKLGFIINSQIQQTLLRALLVVVS